MPARGRYQLHNAIDDCIVCDKCAQVCPVDCIEIDAIKAPAPIGKTSNGMAKRLAAARFDIDLAKCCFCGLCTTVCPTQCLTMTPEYDYSVFDWAEHKVSFATMTPGEIAKCQQS
jgi:NADH-quinone oxidoreductase subunit I